MARVRKRFFFFRTGDGRPGLGEADGVFSHKPKPAANMIGVEIGQDIARLSRPERYVCVCAKKGSADGYCLYVLRGQLLISSVSINPKRRLGVDRPFSYAQAKAIASTQLLGRANDSAPVCRGAGWEPGSPPRAPACGRRVAPACLCIARSPLSVSAELTAQWTLALT